MRIFHLGFKKWRESLLIELKRQLVGYPPEHNDINSPMSERGGGYRKNRVFLSKG